MYEFGVQERGSELEIETETLIMFLRRKITSVNMVQWFHLNFV